MQEEQGDLGSVPEDLLQPPPTLLWALQDTGRLYRGHPKNTYVTGRLAVVPPPLSTTQSQSTFHIILYLCMTNPTRLHPPSPVKDHILMVTVLIHFLGPSTQQS